MKISEFVVNFLIEKNITDVFGIPGGVLLDFLYALDKRKDKIKTHLMFHEQNAAFAANGYAQSTQKIGVAFATKGPGVLNFTTAIADAYYDSLPTVFITSHTLEYTDSNMRIVEDQELNIIPIFSSITKYCIRIDTVGDFLNEFSKAVEIANNNRKGPVLIDISSKLWNLEIEDSFVFESENYYNKFSDYSKVCDVIKNALIKSQKPLLLIGDGIRQSKVEKELIKFSENNNLPVIYSRGCQDIMSGSKMAFGYIGSHGIRYANFILSETDLIICLGNRMSFPLKSESFLSIFHSCKVIRCDIDESEFLRIIPNCENYLCDVGQVLKLLSKEKIDIGNKDNWLNKCTEIRNLLYKHDTETPVFELSYLLDKLNDDFSVITSDVGNNEFWLSRAYEVSINTNKVLYSRSFGTMGSSIGKSIGAYYATKKSILCFVGDQGFQMNPQELQFISNNNLPIWIVIINNKTSGMIKSREIRKFNSKFLLTTEDSGYSVVNFERLAYTYNFSYVKVNNVLDFDNKIIKMNFRRNEPLIIELCVDENIDLEINLPIGNKCQDMLPKLDKKIYSEIEKLWNC